MIDGLGDLTKFFRIPMMSASQRSRFIIPNQDFYQGGPEERHSHGSKTGIDTPQIDSHDSHDSHRENHWKTEVETSGWNGVRPSHGKYHLSRSIGRKHVVAECVF